MKKLFGILTVLLFFLTTFFISCQNKTKKLLTKKWDCVQVENLEPLSNKLNSAKDSAIAIRMTSALKELQWDFKDNMEYECSTGGRITVKGRFSFTNDKKSIICTSTKGNTAIYDILELNETELVLKNLMENANIILHFRVSGGIN